MSSLVAHPAEPCKSFGILRKGFVCARLRKKNNAPTANAPPTMNAHDNSSGSFTARSGELPKRNSHVSHL